MKRHSAIFLTIILILSCALLTTSLAQKKKRPTGTRRPAVTAPPPVVDMRAEANQVIEQIKNVSKFLYIYGKVANGLEIAEDQAKRGQVSSTVAAQNKQSKDTLVNSISGLRSGVDKLAGDFRANPKLQVQYLKVSYAAESAANAQQLASAGQYDEASKALVTVIEKLTDALISMRLL